LHCPAKQENKKKAMKKNGSTESFDERRQRALSINLAEILQFVGPGQFQFDGLVSKAWHALIHTVSSVNRKKRHHYSDTSTVDTFTVLSRMTTYDAVFASTSRCRWALDTGFKLVPKSATRAAGLHASIDTLTMILEQLKPHTLVKTIISDRSIDVLQWALTHLDSTNFDKGDEESTNWYMQLQPSSTSGREHSWVHPLFEIAGRDFLEAAKWFKEKGACWPSTLGSESANWPNHLVEWARSENCTAPLHIT
jgi:hypothetical protein